MFSPAVKASLSSPPAASPPSSPGGVADVLHLLKNFCVIKKSERCLPPHLLAHLLRLGNDGPPGGLGEGGEEEVAGGTRHQLLHQGATLAPPGFLKLNIQSKVRNPIISK